MFAIVNIAGKQYRVAQGDKVKVSSVETEAGKKVKLDLVDECLIYKIQIKLRQF